MPPRRNELNRVPVFLKGPSTPHLAALAQATSQERVVRFQNWAKTQRIALDLDPAFQPLRAPKYLDNPPDRTGSGDFSDGPDILLAAELALDDPEDIPQELDGFEVYANPSADLFSSCLDDAPDGDIGSVSARLSLNTLHARGADGHRVAIAIVDEGLDLTYLATKLGSRPTFDIQNSWRPAGVQTEPGAYPTGHGTMCAHAALLAAPRATLLDYPVFARSPSRRPLSAGLVSNALDGWQALWRSWIDPQPGSLSHYRAVVCCNSWGIYHPSEDFPSRHPGRYVDNVNHPVHAFVSMLANVGIDLIFAAGNCGAGCPHSRCQQRTAETIMGANANADVLTVAACDIHGRVLGYSSRGPSITGMPPNKPDIAAFAHYLGSEVRGKDVADSGTSAAAPLAGGVVAALRSLMPVSALPPAAMFERLRRSAARHPGTGWEPALGFGVINPIATLDGPRV